MPKRHPTEFTINMNLDKMMILQQAELNQVGEMNYFDEYSPCHLYFIGKRPRVLIDQRHLIVNKEYVELKFLIQNQNDAKELPIRIKNNFGTETIKLESNYPYTTFKLSSDERMFFGAKASIFLQTFFQLGSLGDFLDFEVLYIGQSYGVNGARTAPDRLVNHSTLQGIYAEAISNNPDNEIWIALASFTQIILSMFDGRTKFTEEEENNSQQAFVKLHTQGISEQQRINFTEAALIKYFQPPYNKIYKDSFPNPAHKTYSECYDLDVNSVCIEMQTYDIVNCQFYSEAIEKAPWHLQDFFLHSRKDRISMFDFTL